MLKKSPQQYIENVKLPTIPEVAASLLAALNDDDFDMDSIAGIIQRDPVITATVLRNANSARYGLATKVKSVEHATRLLGYINIQTIALGASVSSVFSVSDHIDINEINRYCELHANFSSTLAKFMKTDQSQAWLSGFICRIGEILISNVDPYAVQVFELRPSLPGDRWKREISFLGFSEGAVVAELARSWNFPDQVVSTLLECSTPFGDEYPFHKLSGIVHVAGLLSDGLIEKTATAEMEKHLPLDVLRELNLGAADVLEIYDTTSKLEM